MMELYLNTPKPEPLPTWMNERAFSSVKRDYEHITGYEPTPLLSLCGLAEKLSLGGVYIKDESKRFGLNAFKALGALNAVRQAAGSSLSPVKKLVAATDGNFGRAVAWAAKREGLPAVIFMSCGTKPERAEAIRSMGMTTVILTDRNYDETIHMAYEYAQKESGLLVQDTELPGFQAVARSVAVGYSVMPAEALEQMKALEVAPTHVFAQAGVGSMAGGVLGYLTDTLKENAPKFGVVETWEVPCIMESAKAGHKVIIDTLPVTSMAGLNCGEPNPQTLPLLLSHASCFLRCKDEVTFEGMRRLAKPIPGDPPVISGECGAVTLGALIRLMKDEAFREAREALQLGKDSQVLLFSTEGDTDPKHYREIVESAEPNE
ncbi:MAG: diaminopropionate ammonia-lyase [Eubacteriales bacterium]|nr:diaminopropionate ammonia-lyase [Eubacteriales bacterium]